MDRVTSPQTSRESVDRVPGDEVERLRAELQRARAENRTLARLNRLQGRFVAMASHEFKTPLTSITAYTDAMLAHVDDPHFDRGGQFLGVIRDEAARLLRMVNRILDFSRLEYGSKLLDRCLVDLPNLARDTVAGFGAQLAQRNQTAVVLADPPPPPAEVDADLLRQVLVNLVGNAVKYTADGSRIEISLVEGPATVAVAVSDDGPGIPSEEMQKVFQEFYRSDDAPGGAQGTGLGLSIVRHIVRLHGGHVAVGRSAAGGTAFTVQVPKVVHVAPAAADEALWPGRSVLRNLLRLLAESTDSRSAFLFFPGDRGELTPLAWLGLPDGWPAPRPVPGVTHPGPLLTTLGWRGDHRDAEDGWLMLELECETGPSAWVLVGRRPGGQAFGPTDRGQARVLGRLAARALAAARTEGARTLESIRVLQQIRWRGVPTADPAALQMAWDLGRALGLDEADAEHLQDAAALHDAGMARVEGDILRGTSDLSWDDREEIDRHVQLGLDLMQPLLKDTAVHRIIRHHHERWDGTGHPAGLRGQEIPLGSRVLAVVDAWFSLTRERPYRQGLTPDAALAEIRRCAGSQFDPAAVDALVPVVDPTARDATPAATTSEESP